jgi:hypothetical protein
MSDDVTRRYYLKPDRSLDLDCVAELPEINTGDPQALIDFVSWAIEEYPAERNALVLWNHGSGWKDEDIYKAADRRGIGERITRGQMRSLSSGKPSRVLFNTTVEQMVVEASERAILFDDSAADFLDNIELKKVLQQVKYKLGRPVDLVGFDACLMNMLEVDYQIQDLCGFVVGSQDIEPGDGWPYDAILAHLAADQNMTAETLGRVIVDEYVDFYKDSFTSLPITLSTVCLERLMSTAEVVSELGGILKDRMSEREGMGIIFRALRYAQSFTDRDYVDLANFCQHLALDDAGGEIGAAALQVADSLRGEESPIVAEGHHGPEVRDATGLSIYLPSRVYSPLYDRLDFARQFAWDEFLQDLVSPH